MIKRIIYTLIPVLALGFALFAWYTIDQRQRNNVVVEDFFDDEALLYGSIHDVGDLLRGIQRSQPDLLSKLPFEEPVLKALEHWDEVGSIEEWNHVFSRLTIHFVVYLDAGNANFGWLFNYENDVEFFIQELVAGFSKVTEGDIDYNNSKLKIKTYEISSKKVDNFLLFSEDKKLLDRLERNIQEKNHVDFRKFSEHAGLNLQFNQSRMKTWLSEVGAPIDSSSSWMNRWMTLTHLDIHFKNNTLFASSLTHNEDWLSVAKELRSASKEQLKIIPAESNFFVWMNFSNEGFYRAYNNIFNEKNDLKSFDYLKWIDGEVTFFELDSSYYMMVSSKFSEYDPDLVLEDLNVSHAGQQVDSLEYQDYSSYRLKKFYAAEKFKDFIPGYLNNHKRYNWYTSMGDQIVLSSSKEGLESFVDHFTAQQFLLSDEDIESKINPHHGELSSFLVYDDLSTENNSPLSQWYESSFSDGDFTLYWSLNNTSENNVLHHLSWTNNSLQPSVDSSSSEDGRVWQKDLDYTPTGNYITFYDPSNGNVMLIEGDDEYLHYIKSNGEEIKRVELTGALVGNPQFISANKGKEKYLMYNTTRSVYLSDLQGNIHTGFPFESNKKISGTARIFDYENDGRLRIIIPLSNGYVENINKNGKIVEGWKMKKVEESFVSYPRHFIREGKDYMCFFTASKKLYAVDRRGELRPGFPLDFKGWTGGDVKLSVANTIADSYIRYITKEGQLQRVYFSGEKDAVDLVHQTKHYTWDFEDLTGDGNSEFIATREGYITVYNDVGIEIYSYPTSVIDLHALQVIDKKKGESYLGYLLKSKEQLILLDAFGELRKGYPLEATNLFLTMDVNDDNKRELVFFNNNKLICTKNW